jgi:vacuolar iron transporter family protein
VGIRTKLTRASQREIRVESSELTEDPKGEGEELQLIYEAKGLKSAEAREVVDKILEDRESALDALVREELGIDPAVLGGSPFEAAAASFVLFSVGAIISILPFLLPLAGSPMVVSLLLSGIALFMIGAAITIFTGAPTWRSGARQLLLGLAAAGVTYGIGHVVGVSLS